MHCWVTSGQLPPQVLFDAFSVHGARHAHGVELFGTNVQLSFELGQVPEQKLEPSGPHGCSPWHAQRPLESGRHA
jgi:hypothetical protein